jgi:resuscitation-promoting factor RpfB
MHRHRYTRRAVAVGALALGVGGVYGLRPPAPTAVRASQPAPTDEPSIDVEIHTSLSPPTTPPPTAPPPPTATSRAIVTIAPTTVPSRAVARGDDVWSRLAQCESGGNPATATGNGYYGAFQFLPSTWRSIGETGLPHQFSYEHQLEAAKRLQARSGWSQWPACARKLGLR